MPKKPVLDDATLNAATQMLTEALTELAGPDEAARIMGVGMNSEWTIGHCPSGLDRNHLDRIEGCLFGLAIGDALGAPVEFLPKDAIHARYGKKGVQDFQPWGRFSAGTWTDDTQMALATVAGLIDMCAAITRMNEALRSGAGPVELADPIECVYQRYLEWLAAQEDPYHNRAPGNTCLSALRSGEIGAIDEPLNDSKGCGGAMRTPPVGLLIDPPDAFQLAAEFAAITHGHPSGYLSAGLVAEIVGHLRQGKPLGQAIGLAKKVLKKHKGHEETLAKLELAQALAKRSVPPALAIAQLGEGWVGEEAVAIAVYCALKFPEDFRGAVLAAVNITGDSDSTGAITGAIVGTQIGYKKLPKTWREGVAEKEMIWEVGVRYLAALPEATTTPRA